MKYKQHFELKIAYSELYEVIENEDKDDESINYQMATGPTEWHDIELPNYFK